jgi:peptidoglycan-associated lipoprotein
VAIERLRAELVNTLSQEIFFDFDKFDIRSQDMAVLDQKATIMASNGQVRIRIAGHADERGSDEYNLVLGNRRALAAKAYLERKGIAASRIDVVSYGEERPADPSATEAAWARNRRGAFEVVAGRDQLGTIR